MAIGVRDVRDDERAWLAGEMASRWGSARVVSRGRMHQAARLPALVAEAGGERLGFAAYEVRGAQCELVAIAALRRRAGVGSALLAAVADEARRRGCRRLWLITTNDNVDALRFYQRRGLRLVAVHRGAVDAARRELKPEIPLVGEHGIGIHDEIELELDLA